MIVGCSTTYKREDNMSAFDFVLFLIQKIYFFQCVVIIPIIPVHFAYFCWLNHMTHLISLAYKQTKCRHDALLFQLKSSACKVTIQ